MPTVTVAQAVKKQASLTALFVHFRLDKSRPLNQFLLGLTVSGDGMEQSL
jgi:hypothetical protein